MLSADLYDTVRRFVDAELSIAELEDWLAPRLSAYLHIPNSPDARVVGAIELALVEFSEGMHDEVAVRRILRQSLDRHTSIMVDWNPHSLAVTTSSNTTEPTVTILPKSQATILTWQLKTD